MTTLDDAVYLELMMKAVHENAVAHGWWDEPRSEKSIRALIHSEWSEALEEARAGRPLIWHACKSVQQENAHDSPACESYWDCVCKMDEALGDYDANRAVLCPDYIAKPEGIAVELIDGCIRILDYLGYCGCDFLPTDYTEAVTEGKSLLAAAFGTYDAKTIPLDELVDELHDAVNRSRGGYGRYAYKMALCMAFAWISAQGLDPAAVMLEKHRYNEKRPYKHGKRF